METVLFLGSSAEDGKLKIEENEKIEEEKSGQAAKADSLDGFGEKKLLFRRGWSSWGIFWFGGSLEAPKAI